MARPVALIILDGFGMRDESFGNAVMAADKPNFDRYWEQYPHTLLNAKGEYVGLPEGQMGNSEVGHLNIGAGRVVYQSLSRVNNAIQDRSFFDRQAMNHLAGHVKKHDSSLHIMGLVSDGGIHSHIKHMYAIVEFAKLHGIEKVYIHAFTDGRDCDPKSGAGFLKETEEKLAELGVGQVASVSGRYYAMDRDNRWERVEKVYDVLVNGKGEVGTDPVEVLKKSYENDLTDEFVLPTVIEKDGKPIATIQDNDAIMFFNFRPDRAIQLSKVFKEKAGFEGFKLSENHPENLLLVSMTKYSDDIDTDIVFPPEDLKNTLGETLSAQGYKQLRAAETEKYPHVTFFLNGQKEKPFEGEDRLLVPSPKVATYDLQPEMSAYELTDGLLERIESDEYDAYIINFANPDMVGHSGKLEPTKKAIEAVDECLGKVVDALLAKGGAAIITADHGNADIVTNPDGSPMTAHTTEPVPCIITKEGVELKPVLEGALCDLAPTLLDLLGGEQPAEMTGSSIVTK
ncbi:2,3-bisphosphoglycerate-independent phosphoglycerate mutase [Exiguobacterium aestuarii]|uniref:2,3-bisphosphoglycerate-independent phosphoglycerate mutase n=1 Tax=Exiguobacterium aestuarii TaxID=273527 RepID=A0ABW2PMC8_9BACL|nr:MULTISPECIES: 2,3-bisphosphoglycerate-independent phosphoglycerate mutase [Exiguobacterium]MCT4787590.1 2,3-bisphosphoglycerate-independent phosphoglycerate mutase [Exiguobacterium aestuarii]